ncbi:MAG: hypothetical protein ACFFDW_15180, partial [Candidatus Thorarchaeota archaeon]
NNANGNDFGIYLTSSDNNNFEFSSTISRCACALYFS